MQNLFGQNEPDPVPIILKRGKRRDNWRAKEAYNRLVFMFGVKEYQRCKDCIYFHRRKFGNTFFKCEKIDPLISGNPATDHRANWIACGKFEPKEISAPTK